MTRFRIKTPYGLGFIVSAPDYHSFIVKLDTGKTVKVESYDCKVLP
jgi:hypothetical protein